MSVVLFELSLKLILIVVQLIRAQFFNPLSSNLLSWAHWVNTPHTLGLDRKQRPYTGKGNQTKENDFYKYHLEFDVSVNLGFPFFDLKINSLGIS